MVKKKRNKHKVHNFLRAFTIIELVVIISVVAILSTLAIISYGNIRKDSRDTTRDNNIVIISEALEKYYEKNGEYPSVASLVNTVPGNTGSAVASKLSIDPNILVMPNMPSSLTNGISQEPDPDNDTIAYVGIGSDPSSCQDDPNGGCDSYALRYVKEATGDIEVVESRHKTREDQSVDTPALTLSGASSTSINVSWTNVSAASYLLHWSTSSNFVSPSNSTFTTTNTTTSGLVPDTEYFFRVRAVSANGSVSEWSPTQSESTGSVSAPSGITITAAMSGSNARGTAGGGTCTAGATLERQIRYSSTNSGTAGAWQAWVTASVRDIPASEGYQYTFQSQARCTVSGRSSAWAQSGTASTFRPITTAPTTPVLSVTTSPSAGSVTWTWSMTCPTGTTKQYLTRRTSTEASYDSGWSTTPTTSQSYTWSNSEGYNLSMQVQGRCTTSYSSTGYLASGVSSAIAPIRTPAAPTNFVYYLRSDRLYDQWTWTNPSCGGGTRPEHYENSYLAGAGWYWVETGQEGWRYGSSWSPIRQYEASPIYGTNNQTPYPSNSSNIKVQHKAFYYCLNTVTRRVSAAGPVGYSAYTTVPSW